MPRVVDHDQRRRELALAACAVIARAGLDGATLRDVAAEAGCTTGMVSHYYADKSRLIVAALDAASAAAGERILRRATADPTDLRAVLAESLPLDERRRAEWRVWTAFWGAAVGDGELRAEHRGRYDAWRAAIGLVLTRREECRPAGGRRTAAELGRVAETIMAVVDGIGLHATFDPQRWTAADQLDRLEELLGPEVRGPLAADPAAMHGTRHGLPSRGGRPARR